MLPESDTTAVQATLLDEATCVLAARGELDMATAPQLEQAPRNGASRVVIDLSGCTFLDSTALHTITRLERSVVDDGGFLTVVVSEPNLLRLFELTALDECLTIVSTLSAALDRPPEPPAEAAAS